MKPQQIGVRPTRRAKRKAARKIAMMTRSSSGEEDSDSDDDTTSQHSAASTEGGRTTKGEVRRKGGGDQDGEGGMSSESGSNGGEEETNDSDEESDQGEVNMDDDKEDESLVGRQGRKRTRTNTIGPAGKVKRRSRRTSSQNSFSSSSVTSKVALPKPPRKRITHRARFSDVDRETLEKEFTIDRNPDMTKRNEIATRLNEASPDDDEKTPTHIKNWFKHRRQKKPGDVKTFTRDQVAILEKSYKINHFPDQNEKISLSSALQIPWDMRLKNWFSDRRFRGSTPLLLNTPLQAMPTRNINPQVFSILKTGDGTRMMWRPLLPSENTSKLWKLYLTFWEDETGVQMGTSVCITLDNNMDDAAKVIYNAIMNGTERGCSFRLFVRKNKLRPRHGSIGLGIYGDSELATKKPKWYLRWMVKAMGTLKPLECIEMLHGCAEYLNEVARQCLDLMDPKMKRWMDFSSDAMERHINDLSNPFPGTDEDLDYRFKTKEKYGFDPEADDTQIVRQPGRTIFIHG
ncbi:uncharacterized protein LOC118438720 [Folsomia candida]|nr:uncharacterized protein LOC118438720 [Folsomia candida]